VAGTILAVDTFLGVILGISQASYARATAGGEMHVVDTGDSLGYNLVLDDDPEKLKDKTEVRFRVKQMTASPEHTPVKKRTVRTSRHDEGSEG
jgi:hypothetical protein